MKKLSILLILLLFLCIDAYSQKVAYAVLKDSTLTFYYGKNKPAGAYNVEKMIEGEYDADVKEWGGVSDQIQLARFDKSFKGYRPQNCSSWFYGCENLTSIIGIKENLNTSEVTDMKNMFYNCQKLVELDVSGFNTENVTDMHEMFYYCIQLQSLDVSGFNTEKVTNMWGMFEGCAYLTSLDVSGFNTDKVINMAYMFKHCESLKSLDVSGFQTYNVRNMEGMFDWCSNLTSLDVSGFKTDNVINMEEMFFACRSLTSLDVSGFDTYNVAAMGYMFAYCLDLTTIYVGNDWCTSNIFESENMFRNCLELVGGQGTKYDPYHTDVDYAHIDGGESNPGYLTKKTK
ncbi:MAG: BspA family leucine-rich repeat surface protein [Bacteroidales bacterium]|nr:BspA family leucine-rich repeat surface protein [Bacteroidales bacterium]